MAKRVSILKRFARTLVPASIGALAGYVYAKQMLSPELFGNSSLPGLYITAGAGFAILAVRVVTLGIWIAREVFGLGPKKDDEEE